MGINEFVSKLEGLKYKQVFVMVWDNKKQYLDIYTSDIRPIYAKEMKHFETDEKIIELEWKRNNKLLRESELKEAYEMLIKEGYVKE